jgi:hypothetical protein
MLCLVDSIATNFDGDLDSLGANVFLAIVVHSSKSTQGCFKYAFR